MTGIERLHKLIADIDVNADPELWYILRVGTEGDWDCEKNDDKTLGGTLAAIADQIEREQGGRVSFIRVLSVVTEMERHCLGHEGMEDSPVARWARELREALGALHAPGFQKSRKVANSLTSHSDASDVSMSAYDLLPQEDREAIAWVRERGGLDAVKRRWECLSYYADPVPRVCMERRLARRQRQIDECHEALRHRNQRIDELTHRVSDLTTENAELRKRAMPEGCEWPRYESADLVMFGDCVENRNGICTVKSVHFYSGGGVSVYGEDRDAQFVVVTEPVMRDPIRKARPKVLASDGEPLEVGQTVWDTNGDELVIGAIEDGGHTVTCRYADVGDGIPTHGMWSPSDLTHQRPVLAADGKPLRVGETVWLTDGSEGHVVLSTDEDAIGNIVTEIQAPGLVRVHISPRRLTHERPDSWERIEDDATLSPEVYCHRNGIDISQKDGTEIFLADTVEPMARDLVRRCRALAERERGE